jgi:hypothetical protein
VCHEFLTIHQPKVIVLGAAIVSCIRLRKYFNEVSYSYDEHILFVLFGFNPTIPIGVMTFYLYSETVIVSWTDVQLSQEEKIVLL